MKKTLQYLLIFIGIHANLPLYAQYASGVRVADVEIQYVNDRVEVCYKIVNGKKSDKYIVWVEFFNKQKMPVNAKTIYGDINQVEGLGEKKIIWDVKADGLILDEELTAQVNIKLLPDASLGKALAYSTLFPGAGDYQYRSKRPYWLKGFFGYGLLGGAAGTYALSTNSYNQYLASNNHHTQDPNYHSAVQYRQLSLLLAGTSAAVWLLDYYGLFSKSARFKKLKPEKIIASKGYKQFSSISDEQHISTRSLPPNLFADLEFIDDNGNGILESRESAKLRIILSNQGNGDAMQLKINVMSDINDKSLHIQNAHQQINILRPGEKKEIEVPITTDINLKTATHRLGINVSEYYGYDMEPAYLILNTYAYQPPQFVLSGLEFIDTGAGTSALKTDGQLQAGEQVKVKVVLQNTGQSVAKNAAYKITTTDGNIYIDDINGKLGNMMSGEVKELFFTLSPNKRVTTKENLPLFISVTEESGQANLINKQLAIALDQMPPKPNIVEIKPDMESLKKNVARFEYTSNKFRANIANVVDITAVAPSKTKRKNSVGVVIGVSKYRELPPAPYADNDARIMKDYFQKVLGVEQVIQFTNEQVAGFFFDDIFNPNVGELRKAIVKGETEVFIFYSGHGVPDKDGQNIYLFPSDGKINRLEAQGYNIEKLYENLNELDAKHITVILDACFSGASRSTAKIGTENLIAQKGVKIRSRNTWFNDPNFTVISSSTGEETSLGFDDTETGLFTYYFAAGLQGAADANNDKTITLGELREYVTRNVRETSGKILGQQTPVFRGDDNIIMATY